VGVKRRNLLLTHFKSITEIKNTPLETIKRLGIPEPTAKMIQQYLNEHAET